MFIIPEILTKILLYCNFLATLKSPARLSAVLDSNPSREGALTEPCLQSAEALKSQHSRIPTVWDDFLINTQNSSQLFQVLDL